MFGTWCRSSEQSTIRAAGCRDRNNPRTCFGLGCAASVVARFGSADGGEVCQPRGCAPCSCNSHGLAPGYILSPLRGCFRGLTGRAKPNSCLDAIVGCANSNPQIVEFQMEVCFGLARTAVVLERDWLDRRIGYDIKPLDSRKPGTQGALRDPGLCCITPSAWGM